MKIETTLGDITQCATDAIVNAANKSLLGGGGVDGAIHKAAGPKLLEFCKTLGGCETGEAKITPGFNLAAKYVIHAVGPVYNDRSPEASDALLRDCYLNALRLAAENGCVTIAFPSISTGAYRFPLDRAAGVVASTLAEYGRVAPNSPIRRFLMVCFDEKTFAAYSRALPSEV